MFKIIVFKWVLFLWIDCNSVWFVNFVVGILFCGELGIGKIFLVKVVVGEVGVNFFLILVF